MADELRGEVEVEVGGKTYILHAVLPAIREVEKLTGAGWQELMSRSLNGNLFFDDIVAMVWSCARGSKKNPPDEIPDYEAMAELILTEGLGSIIPSLGQLVLLSASGNKSAEELKKNTNQGRGRKKKTPAKGSTGSG